MQNAPGSPKQPLRSTIVASIAYQLLSLKPLTPVTLADLLAVMQSETGRDGWFCAWCGPFKANLKVVTDNYKITEADWTATIRGIDGQAKGLIPKFRLEPSYMGWAKQAHDGIVFSPIQQAQLSCSWGLGQQMARWYLASYDSREWMPRLVQFRESPELQIRQLISALEVLLTHAHGNRELAYTRYNAGPNTALISKYGMDTYEWYKRFALQLKNEGVAS